MRLLLLVLSAPLLLQANPPRDLVNGSVADLKSYPASVWVKLDGGLCSATVVGEKTVFIAAHCVSDNALVSFSIGHDHYSAICTYSKDYDKNETADFALCVANKVVIGIPYEHINTKDGRLKLGDKILLTGYGCTDLEKESGGNDGTYRIGESKVQRLPTPISNYIWAKQGALLCPGDSGGPAFLQDTATGERWVTATNSAVSEDNQSYLSATFTPQALRFFKAWSEKTGEKICGVHLDAKGCR